MKLKEYLYIKLDDYITIYDKNNNILVIGKGKDILNISLQKTLNSKIIKKFISENNISIMIDF